MRLYVHFRIANMFVSLDIGIVVTGNREIVLLSERNGQEGGVESTWDVSSQRHENESKFLIYQEKDRLRYSSKHDGKDEQ